MHLVFPFGSNTPTYKLLYSDDMAAFSVHVMQMPKARMAKLRLRKPILT